MFALGVLFVSGASAHCQTPKLKQQIERTGDFINQCRGITLSIASDDDKSAAASDFNSIFRGTAGQLFNVVHEEAESPHLKLWIVTEQIPGSHDVALSTALTMDDSFVAHKVDVCRRGNTSVADDCALPILMHYGHLILTLPALERQSQTKHLNENSESEEVSNIWSHVFTEEDGKKMVATASAAKREPMIMLFVNKFGDADDLTALAKKDGFHAKWFVCGAVGALCATIPKDEAARYASHIFSSKFALVADVPLGIQAWNQGWYAFVIKGVSDNPTEETWFSRSPSPRGWVSVSEGVAAYRKHLAKAGQKK
jgi:hypothetical protein